MSRDELKTTKDYNNKALLVGVSNYKRSFGYREFCDRQINELAEFLAKKGNYSVTVLTTSNEFNKGDKNKFSSRDNIIIEYKKFIKNLTNKLVLHFL